MKVGDRVRCIDARGQCFLRAGGIYTVTAIRGPFIEVGEYPFAPKHRGWYAVRFTRIQRTDISILTAMLKPADLVPA